MQTEAITEGGPIVSSHLEAQAYLEALQALAGEIDRAMEAIVERALPKLEESTSRQLALCTRLAAYPALLNRYRTGPASSPSEDVELEERISVATANLVSLNKRYSALLKYSGDTVRLLAGLFRTYNGSAHQAGAMSASYHTWSCEL